MGTYFDKTEEFLICDKYTECIQKYYFLFNSFNKYSYFFVLYFLNFYLPLFNKNSFKKSYQSKIVMQLLRSFFFFSRFFLQSSLKVYFFTRLTFGVLFCVGRSSVLLLSSIQIFYSILWVIEGLLVNCSLFLYSFIIYCIFSLKLGSFYYV